MSGMLSKATAQIVDQFVIDSDMRFSEAVAGQDIPWEILKNLKIVSVSYLGFDDKLHFGQLVIHQELVSEVKEIFRELLLAEFPIKSVKPIVVYDWDDDASMRDNNTSCFNYRTVGKSRKLSDHAFGRAIDINPLLNPYIKRDKIYPPTASYNPEVKGTITKNSPPYKIFRKYGWYWGGVWRTYKDYQHFYKK